jgi:hypothetical protein
MRQIVYAGLGFAIAACTPARAPDPPPKPTREVIEARGRAVLEALKARDEGRLAALVHPTKGVRFSPYAYVHPESDVVLRREQIAGMYASAAKRVWGTADGSGAPIEVTFAEYDRRFVYNADYRAAPRVAYDSLPLHSGNTPSNIGTVYPGTHRVEYNFPGFDPKYEGMDWTSLTLVFERAGDAWYLVGVIHGMWTI